MRRRAKYSYSFHMQTEPREMIHALNFSTPKRKQINLVKYLAYLRIAFGNRLLYVIPQPPPRSWPPRHTSVVSGQIQSEMRDTNAH